MPICWLQQLSQLINIMMRVKSWTSDMSSTSLPLGLCSLSTHTHGVLIRTASLTWICPSSDMPSFSSSSHHDSTPMSNSFNTLATASQYDTFTPSISSTPIKVTGRAKGANKPSLKFISINVNCLRGKSLQIQELINTDNLHVILCQETKLDSSDYSPEIFPPHLTSFTKIVIFTVVACV